MDNIGVRATKEIYSRIDSEHSLDELLEELDMTRPYLWQYGKKKRIPSGKVLRRMALAGYNINYILTGERK